MDITIHVFDERGYRCMSEPAAIPGLLAAGARLWIDAPGESPEVAKLLAETLKLHPLAVEDILQERLVPKIEDYGDYLYIVAHGIVCEHDHPERLETVELDMVLSKQWIFTHHPAGNVLPVAKVAEEMARSPRPLERGPGFVAHAILDHMVDFYLPVVDAFDDEVDEVEAQVIEHPTKALLARIFRLKRSLQRLRRIAVYQREVLKRLSRGEFELIPEKALPFFRDIYDHFVRVADLADSYRELLSGALDAYLSVVSNRMNEVMKALTLVATLMLPITFIAGVYGMNFEHMPELKWRYGYPFSLGLMLVVALGMMFWFKRKRWL
jgi:magnesium transporter